MKKHFFLQKTKMLFIAIFFIAGQNGWGQTLNDYQCSTATTVNLDAATNWEVWDGSAWIAASSAPIGVVSNGNTITILASATYAGSTTNITVPAGVTLVHQGLTKNPMNTGIITFNGTYVHNTIASFSRVIAVTTFSSTSTCEFRGSSILIPASSFSGRTFGNLSFKSTSGSYNISTSGTNALVINGNLSVGSNVTFNYNIPGTPGHSIKGNIVADGNLNFTPTSAGTINFDGTSDQTISGTGLITSNSFVSFIIKNTNNVIVDKSITLTGSAVTINAGSTLTLNSGSTLSIGGNFMINSDGSGTGSFVDKNSSGGLTVSGTTTVQKYLANNIYGYSGIPVNTATSAVFAPDGTNDKLWYYDENLHNYQAITDGSATLLQTVGYVAKYTSGNKTLSYTGTLNTGDYTFSPTLHSGDDYSGYNLVCNPYPSAVDINTASFSASQLETTIWYRSGGNFYLYNWYDQTGTGSNTIPAMQAFWVKVDNSYTSGSLTFANSDRVFSSQAFYKLTSQPNVFKMNVSNGTLSDDMFIGFYPNATDNFENSDSRKLYGDDEYPQVYSLTSDNTKVAINGYPPSNGNKKVVALGFKTANAGTFTFNATNLDEFDATIPVYLEDVQQGIIQDLRQSATYNFSSDAVDDITRFKIHFNGITTNISTPEVSSVYSYAYDNTLYVNTPSANSTIELYDVLGNLISEQKSISGLNKIKINNSKGIYIIKVLNGKDVFTQKVFIK